ncbi:MAG: Gfo/Idh/MocA family oxidoreductase, partial [Thiomargarita sp.]|nr:Gfo/Idh/MocA family oxidoreductase [Thiomargarita sp.]
MKNTPITDRKIKIALIGCGRISNKHFEAISQHATDLKLVSICDTDSQILAETVKKTGVQGFHTLEDLLSKTDADVIILCTPSGLHAKQTIRCAEAGYHVMTEKPMATRWQDGVRMVQACDDAGVRLFVVKQNRRNTTLQMLKRAIDKRRFGRIYMVNINVFWTR